MTPAARRLPNANDLEPTVHANESRLISSEIARPETQALRRSPMVRGDQAARD